MNMLAVRSVRLVLIFGLAAASPLAAQSYTEVQKPSNAILKAAFACPAPQIVFQGPDGKMSCLAPDANPCAHGNVLDKSVSPARCKPAPFTCPAPQLVFQRPDGKMTCIAPDANPCTQGQIVDKTTKPGSATCKPAPFTCPAGQVAVQKPDGRWTCVANP